MRWLLLLLLVPFAGAVDFTHSTPWLTEGAAYFPQNISLGEYPDFLFSLQPPESSLVAKFVKGSNRSGYEISAMNYLLNRMQRDFVVRYLDRFGRLRAVRVSPEEIGGRVVEDVEVVGGGVFVVVGLPCHNSLVSHALGLPCEEIPLPAGHGLVALTQDEMRTYLVFTAGDAETLFETVKRFHNMRKRGLDATALRFRPGTGRVQIGNRLDMLTIGESIGSVTPALTYRERDPRYRQYTRIRDYPGYSHHYTYPSYEGYFTGTLVIG